MRVDTCWNLARNKKISDSPHGCVCSNLDSSSVVSASGPCLAEVVMLRPRNRCHTKGPGDPRIHIPPTMMQVYPKGWQPGMPKCFMVICNCLDVTKACFFVKYRVGMLIKCSSDEGGEIMPPRYGRSSGFSCHDFPVSRQRQVETRWEDLCEACIKIWEAGSPEEALAVAVYCNEGVHEAPAAAALLAAKLHGNIVMYEAHALAECRPINPMFSDGCAVDAWGRGIQETFYSIQNSLTKDSLGMGSSHERHARQWTHVRTEADSRAFSVPHEAEGNAVQSLGVEQTQRKRWQLPPWRNEADSLRGGKEPRLFTHVGVQADTGKAREGTQEQQETETRKRCRDAERVTCRMRAWPDESWSARGRSPVASEHRAFASEDASTRLKDKGETGELELGSVDVKANVGASDDSHDPRDGGSMSDALVDWINRYHAGKFHFNENGRHVLHEMCEHFRKENVHFNAKLFREAVRFTIQRCGDLEQKTTGKEPEATTALSMLCTRRFQSIGCDGTEYLALIAFMIAEGADVNALDHDKQTCVSLAAETQNRVAMQYFAERAVSLGERSYKMDQGDSSDVPESGKTTSFPRQRSRRREMYEAAEIKPIGSSGDRS